MLCSFLLRAFRSKRLKCGLDQELWISRAKMTIKSIVLLGTNFEIKKIEGVKKASPK
jgi:hypothetical protein